MNIHANITFPRLEGKNRKRSTIRDETIIGMAVSFGKRSYGELTFINVALNTVGRKNTSVFVGLLLLICVASFE